ncbi:protein kinase domain-containing protein [Streptomyces sannanensis]
MGRVWRASDEMLDRPVAIKEMRIDDLDAEDSRIRRERTLREARATARIDHPHVVRVYDVAEESDRLWIVMELVEARSLEQLLIQDGPVSPREAARIGLGLVAALREVHAVGVLHRDIKPGNVLIGSGGRVVLTDFGIAAIQDATQLTIAGMLVGSPDYMAPERVGGRPQGPPSDLWSLGATLCAAVGGQSPFSRPTTLATLHAVLYEEPVLPSQAGPLSPVLAALLVKDPAGRPSLDDLQVELTRLAAPPPAVPVRGIPSVPPPGPPGAGEPALPGPSSTPEVQQLQGAPAPTAPQPAAPAVAPPGPPPSGSGASEPARPAPESAVPPPGPAPGPPSSGRRVGPAPSPTPAASQPPDGPAPSSRRAPKDPRRPSAPAGDAGARTERVNGPAAARSEPPDRGPAEPGHDPTLAIRRVPEAQKPTVGIGPGRSRECDGEEEARRVPEAQKPTVGIGPGRSRECDGEEEARRVPEAQKPTVDVVPERGAERGRAPEPGAGPEAGRAPGPGPRPGRRRALLLGVAAAVAATAVTAVLIVSTARDPGGGGGRAGGATTPAPTVAGTSRPPSTGPDTPTPPALPPGALSETGFAWVPPKGWTRSAKSPSNVHYHSPDGQQEIAASYALAHGGDLLAQWQRAEGDMNDVPGYRKIRLDRTTFRGRPAVIWEYAFTEKGEPWLARQLGFTAGGKSYQVNIWYAEPTARDALSAYDRVISSFAPL